MARNSQNSLVSQMLTGPALSYITGILQYVPTVGYAILKQALYEKYDLPQISYKVAFKNTTLREDEIIAYGWDLKYLAVKAYQDQLLETVEPLIIKHVINGFGFKGWSDHVMFHCPQSLQEAIDIAIDSTTFSDCFVCEQNSKCNAHETELRHEHSNKSYYKLTKQTNNTQRFKPYAASCKTCTKDRPRSLAEVQQEHRQLQLSVSSEDAWE